MECTLLCLDYRSLLVTKKQQKTRKQNSQRLFTLLVSNTASECSRNPRPEDPMSLHNKSTNLPPQKEELADLASTDAARSEIRIRHGERYDDAIEHIRITQVIVF